MNRRGFFSLLAGALAAPHLPAPTPVPRPIAFGVDLGAGPDRTGYAVFYDGKMIGRVISVGPVSDVRFAA